MNPVDDAPIRELARRAARLIQTLPIGEPVTGRRGEQVWIREIEIGPYRIVMEEPLQMFSTTTLEVIKGTSIIYSESYTMPRGSKAASDALKFLRQNMVLEDLSDVRT